jgi:hypothetical protein
LCGFGCFWGRLMKADDDKKVNNIIEMMKITGQDNSIGGEKIPEGISSQSRITIADLSSEYLVTFAKLKTSTSKQRRIFAIPHSEIK